MTVALMLSLSICYDLLQVQVDGTKTVRVFPVHEAGVQNDQERKPCQNETRVQAN